IATPTFLRGYLKRCEKDDFASLDLILAGAEKLTDDIRNAMREKFGKELYEGYGMTEMAPLVSVNVPDYRAQFTQTGNKPGTVGRPIPNVAAKVVDLETGKEQPNGKTGMLHVKGPNLMAGYLNRPDLTAEKIVDGWYVTGDLAEIDDEGFITITGRISRFSKIGGEMVPHGKIEDAIHKFVAKDGELKCVVTSVADDRKGERIIVLHTEITKTPDEIRKALTEEGFPNLWVPARDSFFEVGVIPVLGTGKISLSEAKTLAEQKVAAQEAKGAAAPE
ncbi:MAG TPA: AMP-binding protein, partial [Pirellulales bacterium]